MNSIKFPAFFTQIKVREGLTVKEGERSAWEPELKLRGSNRKRTSTRLAPAIEIRTPFIRTVFLKRMG
ncbi:hypothetical protein BC829DRAFT_406863, partial [Chytridium lagenaria]